MISSPSASLVTLSPPYLSIIGSYLMFTNGSRCFLPGQSRRTWLLLIPHLQDRQVNPFQVHGLFLLHFLKRAHSCTIVPAMERNLRTQKLVNKQKWQSQWQRTTSVEEPRPESENGAGSEARPVSPRSKAAQEGSTVFGFVNLTSPNQGVDPKVKSFVRKYVRNRRQVMTKVGLSESGKPSDMAKCVEMKRQSSDSSVIQDVFPTCPVCLELKICAGETECLGCRELDVSCMIEEYDENPGPLTRIGNGLDDNGGM